MAKSSPGSVERHACRWAAAAVAACLVGSARAEVFVVDDDGGGDFTRIQAAVDAAVSGDVVLVESGAYLAFVVQGKGVTVAGTSDSILVRGATVVRDVPAGELVVLSGMTLQGSDGVIDPGPGTPLAIRDCAGSVRVQDCSMWAGELGSPFDDGADAAGNPGSPDGGELGGPAAPAVDVELSDDVVLVACVGEGSLGPSTLDAEGGFGGQGVRVADSKVALLECTFAGGYGGAAGPAFVGGVGGTGVELRGDALLLAAGGVIWGGVGGWGSDFELSTGGTGLDVDARSAAILRGVSVSGGPGSFGVACTCYGPYGADVLGAGAITTLRGEPPLFTVEPTVVAAGEVLTLSGEAPALVLASLHGTLVYLAGQQGPLVVAPPWIGDGILLPSMPVQAVVPSFPPGLEGFVLELQTVTANGLGGAASVVLVDELP